jgi:Protein of unknown function (DUF1501)
VTDIERNGSVKNHMPDRREFLRIAGGGSLALNLCGLLRAQAASDDPNRAALAVAPAPSVTAKIRSCILVFYYGGPSHLDTFDMKPSAPAEVRGEFKPIATSVPGLHICEHLPRMSQIMHKVTLVRSMHHRNRLHDSASTEVLTGRQSPNGDREEFAPIKQFFPSYGATLSYVWRSRSLDVSHAALPFVFHNVVDVPCQGGGFLGASFDPLQIVVDPENAVYRAGALETPADLSRERLGRRRNLLETMDAALALTQTPTAAIELRRYYEKAFQLLDSDRIRRALDITQEHPSTRERYGFGAPPTSVGEGGGGGNGAELGHARQMRGQNLLLARRLVEAGVPFVNVYDFRQQGQNWDAHFKVANQHKTHLLPLADQSLSALIEDLDSRGLLDSTLVIAMGEFGRTPRINKDGGRDHWPDCYTILLAGGGVKGGYVHGASDPIAAYPVTDPVTPADLAATIFWRFGIDPTTEVHDITGRPYRLAEGIPIQSLFTA